MTPPRRDPRGLTRCRDCGRIVRRSVNHNARVVLLDPDPDPDGNQAAALDATGTWRSHQLHKGEQPARHERRYMPHVATCPGPPQQRLPVVLPPGVVDLSARRNRRRPRS